METEKYEADDITSATTSNFAASSNSFAVEDVFGIFKDADQGVPQMESGVRTGLQATSDTALLEQVEVRKRFLNLQEI
jgi:hypothetical protein